MKLSQATKLARKQATTLGHVLADFSKDTLLSAVASCTQCNRLASVDVSETGEHHIHGRAAKLPCPKRPTVHFHSGLAVSLLADLTRLI